jgi:PAS domain S-box-containing protein
VLRGAVLFGKVDMQEDTTILKQPHAELEHAGSEVSSQNHSNRTLQQSEQRYRELVEKATDIIYTTDAGGLLTNVNPAAQKITGYSREELLGKHYLDLIHPEFKKRVEKFYRTQLSKKIQDTYYELPVLTNKAETLWLGQNVQLVTDGDQVLGFRSICRDITERKRAELRLYKTERRFRLLTENAPFGLAVMGNDRKFHYFNPKFTEIFGYTLEDLPDKMTWFEKAFPNQDYRNTVSLVWEADTGRDAEPGEVSPRIFTVRCKDGADKVIQSRAVLMEHGARILTYEDITSQANHECALRESENKYRTLFESANDAIFLMRHDQFIDCNSRALEMFGSTKEQIIGRKLADFSATRETDSPSNGENSTELKATASSGKRPMVERRCMRSDGSVFDTEVSLSRVQLQDETLHLAIVRDVTERVNAKQAIREKEQMLANILAASPVGICRLEERRIGWANDAMTKIFGYPSAELIGKDAKRLYASEDEYQRVGAVLYEGHKTGTESESYAKLIRKDGSLFDGHVRISASDPENLRKDTIAAFSDVSRIRQAEIALEESERRYRRLVEQVPDIIFSLDSTGHFTFVNLQVEKFLGFPVTHMLGTVLRDYAAPECKSLVESLLLVRSDGIWEEEFGVIDFQGNRKWVRIRCQAYCDEVGQPLRYEGVMIDRTAGKILEEELRASKEALVQKIKIIDDLYAHILQSGKAKAIAEHTAEVAHELRQPLAIIGGFARRMVKHLGASAQIDEDHQKECFDIIIGEVQRLEKILGALIDFTKRESIQPETIDPNSLIREVLRIHQEVCQGKDLRIETHFGRYIGKVSVDPNRFQHLIRNLLSNAIEASPEGGAIVIDTGIFVPSDKTQQTGELAAEEYFEMRIRNGGRIIPSEELQKFFDPFYTTKEYGVGIGLTLCKKIVEEHNGSISVRSDEEGTIFTVWFPLRPAKQALND